MKNVFRLSLLVLLLISGRARAEEELDVKVTENRSITIKLNNLTSGAVLMLQGKNGEILFRDSLQSRRHYTRTLDLEVIPNGSYLVSLEKENSVFTRKVVKSSEGVELDNQSQIIFKPCFKVKEREVQIFLNNPGKKTTYFDVYDKGGNLVTSVANRGSVIRKNFDFSQVPVGEYTLKVKVGERTFTKSLKMG